MEKLTEMKTAVFTIASKNYFAYVRTLMQSLEGSNSDMERVVVVVDEADEEFVSLPRNFDLLFLNDLDLPEPDKMKFRYTILELNTAVKPFAFSKLFESYDRVIYLDPDIYVYEPLYPITDALNNGYNFVYTPHLTRLWEEDGCIPDEINILVAGTYNLGFLALNKCHETQEMLAWWAEKLEKKCIVKIETGIFVDQKWMDLVPGLYESVYISHHEGLNVAYWNLSHRKVVRKGDKFFVNGFPLIFFHFSGLNPRNIKNVSKHQDRYTIDEIGDAKDLFEDYTRKVLSNEFVFWSRFKYSYGNFSDGRKISDEMRHYYRENETSMLVCGENPFTCASYFYNENYNGSAEDYLVNEDALLTGGVNLIGYLRSEHGVGEAVRLTATALNAANVSWSGYDYEIGNPSRQQDESFLDNLSSNIVYNTSIININADQLPASRKNLPPVVWKTYKIGVWYWELPEFPEEWYHAFTMVDEIWAPTKFIAECLSKKADCPVIHMPPGISRNPASAEYSRTYFGLSDGAFLFLNMFDVYSFSGRKNPEGVLKAFQDAFAPDDDSVGLVLKVNNAKMTDEFISKLETLKKGYYNIHFIVETLTRDEINGLINVCDASISLHRSEGLGLLCEESMYYGKPVIATAWSGNMDFMNEQNSCLVPYEMVKVGENMGPYEAWQDWAEPDVSQAVEFMRKLRNDKVYYNEISKRAYETIHTQFSPEVCGEKMKQRLEKLSAVKDKKVKNCMIDSREVFFERKVAASYMKIMKCDLTKEEQKKYLSSIREDNRISARRFVDSIALSELVTKDNDRDFLKNLYEEFLNRVPATSEVDHWVNKLQLVSRNEVMEEFFESKEYMEFFFDENEMNKMIQKESWWNIKEGINIIDLNRMHFGSINSVEADGFLSGSEPGYLMYGPYKTIEVGKYSLHISLSYEDRNVAPGTEAGSVDVWGNGDICPGCVTLFKAGERKVCIDNLIIKERNAMFEIRVYTKIPGVRVQGVELIKEKVQ